MKNSIFFLVEKKVVEYVTARTYADHLGIPYLETSAKNNTNVEQAFVTMTAEIRNRVGPPASGTEIKRTVSIESTPMATNYCGAC